MYSESVQHARNLLMERKAAPISEWANDYQVFRSVSNSIPCLCYMRCTMPLSANRATHSALCRDYRMPCDWIHNCHMFYAHGHYACAPMLSVQMIDLLTIIVWNGRKVCVCECAGPCAYGCNLFHIIADSHSLKWVYAAYAMFYLAARPFGHIRTAR